MDEAAPMDDDAAAAAATPPLTPEDETCFLAGTLLFSTDFAATQELLLPQHTVRHCAAAALQHPSPQHAQSCMPQVEALARHYLRRFLYTPADAYVAALYAAGLQPAGLMSGNLRPKLLRELSSECEGRRVWRRCQLPVATALG
jgi:hypothetical protein